MSVTTTVIRPTKNIEFSVQGSFGQTRLEKSLEAFVFQELDGKSFVMARFLSHLSKLLCERGIVSEEEILDCLRASSEQFDVKVVEPIREDE